MARLSDGMDAYRWDDRAEKAEKSASAAREAYEWAFLEWFEKVFGRIENGERADLMETSYLRDRYVAWLAWEAGESRGYERASDSYDDRDYDCGHHCDCE